MSQEQKQPHRSETDEDLSEVEEAPAATDAKEALDSDVDDILDEIDNVLESNAEEFVKSFIQKGGE